MTDGTQRADRRQPPQTPERASRRTARRLIALSLGEIRHLFNLIGKDDHTVDLGIYWSTIRRGHQAEARRRPDAKPEPATPSNHGSINAQVRR